MTDLPSVLTDAIIIVMLLAGVRAFRTPAGARWGNLAAGTALGLAMVLVMARHGVTRPGLVAAATLTGAAVGLGVALRVTTTQIPAMIALQHGAGGLAALLVSLIEVRRGHTAGMAELQAVAGLAGMLIGAGTFSASLVAAGKLSGLIAPSAGMGSGGVRPAPMLFLLAALIAASSGFLDGGLLSAGLLLAITLAVAGGIDLARRVGGADMPVLISFLNATAGFAAAFCGVVLQMRLLVVCGATVAASGSVLTHVMCTSMNRSLFSVLMPSRPVEQPPSSAEPLPGGGRPQVRRAPAARSAEGGAGEAEPIAAAPAAPAPDPLEASVAACRAAQRVIVVPGYGMARAQAQFEVAALARQLTDMGKDVRFAMHPVAGRMPGHMHVLLAEADVSYDKLVEMEQINPEFKTADLALVVGACDVVNPAALSVPDCPISGMPILLAGEAKHVVVCNYDDRPGYSGVDNPLYRQQNTIMLTGDAKESVKRLAAALDGGAPE